MFDIFRWFFFAIIGATLLGGLLGCDKPAQSQEALLFLQQGKAEGELTMTTNPVVAAGWDNRFYFGADKTTLSFNGSIDFADRIRAVPEFPAQPTLPGDKPGVKPEDAAAPSLINESPTG